MGQKIELGKAHNTAIISKPKTLDERINLIERNIKSLTQAFNAVNSAIIKKTRRPEIYNSGLYNNVNKDGIPIGISLLGHSMRGGTHILSVKQNKYCIGISEYDSLSAAAEASSGVRRSGRTFWKMPNGRTIKETFGKTNG